MSSEDIEKASNYEHREQQGMGEQLSRQITLNISPEQYERLFFQPTPARGDLAKRLANPTLLGVFSFLVPFTTVVLSLLNLNGASSASLAVESGSAIFFGGIGLVLAGIAEFVLGNTFPFVVFIIFGCHWVQVGYNNQPVQGLAAAYTTATVEGALAPAYNAGNGFYSVSMCCVCFVLMLGSVRTNIPFVVVFFSLVFVFAFFAAAQFHIAELGAAGVEHAVFLLKVAGGFGFVSILMGWYLAIILTCASTGVPCPLPIFDLSTHVFVGSNAAKDEAAGAGGGAAVAKHN